MNIPQLMYGTAWKEEKTAELVELAVIHGFRSIDTACQPKHYNEKGVGEALIRLRERGIDRESLYIQTKFTPLDGHDIQRIPYDPKSSLTDQVLQSFAVSKKNLGTSYVDSLILHSPLVNYADLLVVWAAMESIYRQGGAKQLGISNCYDPKIAQKLFEDAKVKPSVIQNRFYGATRYDENLRVWCQKNAIIYQGFWTLTANPNILAHKYLHELALKHEKSAVQIFFRFLTQIAITPLVGTCSEAHMQEALAIFNFELSPASVQKIEEILRIG